MTKLTGKQISQTYNQLLKMGVSANTGVDASLTNVQTGDGVNTAIKIATGAMKVAGTFGVESNASISGDLLVTDKVCASAFYGDGSNLTGITMSIGGNISVSNATVGGNLYVSGTTTVVGATHLQSTLSVAAATTIGGALNLLDTVTVSAAAGFKSTVRVSGATSLEGAVVMGSTLTVADYAHFKDDVSVSGNVHIGGTTTIAGAPSIGGAESIGGAVNL